MSKYSDAKIYKLIACGTEECYIGSSCSTLEKRLYQHNYAVANPEKTKQTSASKLYEGGRKVSIELIEHYPCTSKKELDLREKHWIETTETAINKNIPGRDYKERREARKESYDEYMKEFRAKKFECECGSSIGFAEKARHLRSKKHLEYLETL